MNILIGSNNKWKIKDWKEKLREFNLLSPEELGINLDVEEGIISLSENALKKAREFSKRSKMVTISEDTGFFIEKLDGQPGVAFKRWGGELPENVSDQDFIDYLKNKISGLNNPEGYFETVIGIVSPNGKEETVGIKIFGFIDTELLNNLKEIDGFSLSNIFINKESGKVWGDMNKEEQEKLYENMYNGVRAILLKYK